MFATTASAWMQCALPYSGTPVRAGADGHHVASDHRSDDRSVAHLALASVPMSRDGSRCTPDVRPTGSGSLRTVSGSAPNHWLSSFIPLSVSGSSVSWSGSGRPGIAARRRDARRA